MSLLPISVVIPTLNRRERLRQTLTSLLRQSVQPAEIIIIDASPVPVEAGALADLFTGPTPHPQFKCLVPPVRGAAVQRNQGVAAATQPYVLFSDDDVDLEPGCLAILWQAMQSDAQFGACGAIITNQHYYPPGRLMRRVFALLGCPATGSLAGRCVGPALNFLPTLDRDAPAPDWLNLCCTLVRREALPSPPLLAFFHGYSLMEDAALTLEIAKSWRLAAPPGARVFHDTQPASYKDRTFVRERMETINRWFVMRCIMGRDSLLWDARMAALQVFMLGLSLRTVAGWRRLPAALAGKLAGLVTVILHGPRWRGYTTRVSA